MCVYLHATLGEQNKKKKKKQEKPTIDFNHKLVHIFVSFCHFFSSSSSQLKRRTGSAREKERTSIAFTIAQIMLTKKISQSLSLIVLNPFNDGSGNTIRKFSRDVKEIHAQCFPEEHRFAMREEGSRRRQKRDDDERDYRREELDDDQFFDRLCALHEESDQLWILLVKEEPKRKNKKEKRKRNETNAETSEKNRVFTEKFSPSKLKKQVESAVIGFAQGCKYTDSWYGVNIAISRKYRGLKYGSLLMYYGQLHAAKDNVFKVSATADGERKKLVRFYEKHGAESVVVTNETNASVGSKKTSLVKIQKTFDVEVAEREYEAAVREVQDDRVEERLRKRKEMRMIVLAGGVALVALVRFVVCSSRKKKETSNHKSSRR